MRSESEIIGKIAEFRKNIDLLEEKKQEEAIKDFHKRDLRRLFFFKREQTVFEHGILLLEWLMGEERSQNL
jgi:hypothetical protein